MVPARKQFPVAFVLMSRRRKTDYVEVLELIKEKIGEVEVESFVLDFESGAWQAIGSVFPGIEIKGCMFHWTQAVFRRVQQLGLAPLYSKRQAAHLFIRSGLFVMAEKEDDREKLLQAISKNNVHDVETYLLFRGVSPNFVLNGKSPIVSASFGGNERILEMLLERGCNANQKDELDEFWSRRPIHIAASRGYLGIVEMLVDHGVGINTCDGDNRTALHWATTYGENNVAKFLISKGASVNITQMDGFTPLHSASCLGHESVCRILLENGSHVDRADKDGWTPLHTAACYNWEKCVLLMLDYGACVDEITCEGETALHIAASTDNVWIMKRLVEHGAKPNNLNINGYTPFHLAVFHKSYKAAKFLAMCNVNMRMKNFAKQTPLYLAAVRGDERFLKLMVLYGYHITGEEWLKGDKLTSRVVKSEELRNWLIELSYIPRTLKEICCCETRKMLGFEIQTKLKSLSIPSELKQELLSDLS